MGLAVLQDVVHRNPQVRDALSPKHQAMIERILTLVVETPEEVADHVDPSYWERWVVGFETACREISSGAGSIPGLQEHIEQGYKLMMFAASPAIHELERSSERELWTYGPEQIQQVLDEYKD